MGTFHKVAKTTDVEDGEGLAVEVEGETLALFKVGEAFYCLEDTCSHQGGPLSEGFVEDGEVECPWHAATFDLKSGEATCPPAPEGVKAYNVRVQGDDVEIEL